MSTVFDEQPDLGDMDLEERYALRRVAGLSTELQDISEVEYRALRLERVVLIGVWAEGSLSSAENSLRELSRLAETAGSEVLDGLIQRRSRVDAATYVGSGKARELAGIVAADGADTVICDGELTPSQLRRLEGIVQVKVIDRTALILDIFAQHARSREGKAQVELAQLQYMLPRLRGWGESLSRQAGGRVAGGGGIGTRGPGETKLETDRRRLRARIARLKRDISGMSTGRKVQRGQRRRGDVPSVVIAGYTNAGKSSLLNALTGAGVLVEDALFATLDPAVRRAVTPSGRGYTLTDTVGFVRHLPHQLVEAFRSTLEETAEADLILHVVDGSDARTRGADRRGPWRAGRDRRGARARARRGQQDRLGQPGRAAGPARAGAGQPQRLREDGGWPGRPARCHRGRAAPARRSPQGGRAVPPRRSGRTGARRGRGARGRTRRRGDPARGSGSGGPGRTARGGGAGQSCPSTSVIVVTFGGFFSLTKGA